MTEQRHETRVAFPAGRDVADEGVRHAATMSPAGLGAV
jgi:hypothetical protein